MKSGSLLEAIVELSHERDLDQELVISALEDAVLSAATKKYENYAFLEVSYNRKSGDIELMRYRIVVDYVRDAENEILLEKVREFDPDAELGDEVEYEIDKSDFKNVIAQTTRQFLFQRIKEIERESIIEKFSSKKGEIVHGTVARIERNRVILVLNQNAEAALDRREQIPFEKLQPGEHVRAYLLDVRSDSKGPQLLVSRTHPSFLIKLFEMEVPEVYEGIIDIIVASREPGRRAKMAVKSNDSDVDPVGSCVGQRGARVQTIVTELCGERIDIVEWSDDIHTFIQRALAPAEIVGMTLNEEELNADVEVEPDQLSLAIGKQGQNVRLASQLTGVKINVSPWEAKLTETFQEKVEGESQEETELVSQEAETNVSDDEMEQASQEVERSADQDEIRQDSRDVPELNVQVKEASNDLNESRR